MKINYSTVLFQVRERLQITLLQYHLADMVFKLSPPEYSNGWCDMSRSKMAKLLGVDRGTVIRNLQHLVDKGLVKRHPNYELDQNERRLRSTILWWQEAVLQPQQMGLNFGFREWISPNNADSGVANRNSLAVVKQDSGVANHNSRSGILPHNKNSNSDRNKIPPPGEIVQSFFVENMAVPGYAGDTVTASGWARKFYLNYQAVGWKKNGAPVDDWHALAWLWAEREISQFSPPPAATTKKRGVSGNGKFPNHWDNLLAKRLNGYGGDYQQFIKYCQHLRGCGLVPVYNHSGQGQRTVVNFIDPATPPTLSMEAVTGADGQVLHFKTGIL